MKYFSRISTIDAVVTIDGVGDVVAALDPLGDSDGFATPLGTPMDADGGGGGGAVGWPTPAIPDKKFGGMCCGQNPCHKPIFKFCR